MYEDNYLADRLKTETVVPIIPYELAYNKEHKKLIKKSTLAINKKQEEIKYIGYSSYFDTRSGRKNLKSILNKYKEKSNNLEAYIFYTYCLRLAELLYQNFGSGAWHNYTIFYTKYLEVTAYWNTQKKDFKQILNKMLKKTFKANFRIDIKDEIYRTGSMIIFVEGKKHHDDKFLKQFTNGYAMHHVKGNKKGEVLKMGIVEHYFIHSTTSYKKYKETIDKKRIIKEKIRADF